MMESTKGNFNLKAEPEGHFWQRLTSRMEQQRQEYHYIPLN